MMLDVSEHGRYAIVLAAPGAGKLGGENTGLITLPLYVGYVRIKHRSPQHSFYFCQTTFVPSTIFGQAKALPPSLRTLSLKV
jgi:hypothetical protein